MPARRKANTRTNDNKVLWFIYMSTGPNELTTIYSKTWRADQFPLLYTAMKWRFSINFTEQCILSLQSRRMDGIRTSTQYFQSLCHIRTSILYSLLNINNNFVTWSIGSFDDTAARVPHNMGYFNHVVRHEWHVLQVGLEVKVVRKCYGNIV